jgi:hypothetical protein
MHEPIQLFPVLEECSSTYKAWQDSAIFSQNAHRSRHCMTLLQFFWLFEAQESPKSARYVIPNFVGIRTKPCFPINDQYARLSSWFTNPGLRFLCSWRLETRIQLSYLPNIVQYGFDLLMIGWWCEALQQYHTPGAKTTNMDHNCNEVAEEDQWSNGSIWDAGKWWHEWWVKHRSPPRGLDFNWNRPLMNRPISLTTHSPENGLPTRLNKLQLVTMNL